jgi:hypothetical protein
MAMQARDEVAAQLAHLIGESTDASSPALSRLQTLITAAQYLETLRRYLVDEAREQGTSWEDIAQAFGTSVVNVRQRFDTYRRYDED